MSSDLQPEDGSENKKMSRRRFLLSLTVGVFLVVLLGSGVLVGTNVFGKNISGTVTCASGDVMGVFVEAERVPRALGMEMQSGFADWQQTRTSRSASFGTGCPSVASTPSMWGAGCCSNQAPRLVGRPTTTRRSSAMPQPTGTARTSRTARSKP